MIITESVRGLPRYRIIERFRGAGQLEVAQWSYGAIRGATSERTARAAEAVFELDYELEVVDPEDLPPGAYVLLWEDKMGQESFKVLEIL